MKRSNLKPPEDAGCAEWIEPRLTGAWGSVTNAVPDCFEAYGRVLHPASSSAGKLVPWSEVAAAVGGEVHAGAQWHSLVRAAGPDDPSGAAWEGEAPMQGDLCVESLKPLCELLAQHTRFSKECFFGFWTGWGLGSEIEGPRVELPPAAGREYLLRKGSLWAAVDAAEGKEPGLPATSPNLLWPLDRAWFLATEIDFDSTLVGGSHALIESIVESDELEAWRIDPADLLTADADTRNRRSQF